MRRLSEVIVGCATGDVEFWFMCRRGRLSGSKAILKHRSAGERSAPRELLPFNSLIIPIDCFTPCNEKEQKERANGNGSLGMRPTIFSPQKSINIRADTELNRLCLVMGQAVIMRLLSTVLLTL